MTVEDAAEGGEGRGKAADRHRRLPAASSRSVRGGRLRPTLFDRARPLPTFTIFMPFMVPLRDPGFRGLLPG